MAVPTRARIPPRDDVRGRNVIFDEVEISQMRLKVRQVVPFTLVLEDELCVILTLWNVQLVVRRTGNPVRVCNRLTGHPNPIRSTRVAGTARLLPTIRLVIGQSNPRRVSKPIIKGALNECVFFRTGNRREMSKDTQVLSRFGVGLRGRAYASKLACFRTCSK